MSAQGPILAFVYAVKEMLQEGTSPSGGRAGTLPCNVAFAIEGEEENGSAGFQEAWIPSPLDPLLLATPP